MITLEFNVDKQTITRLDNEKIVSNSSNIHQCHFSFSEDWDDKEITATFCRDRITIAVILDENNNCFIPSRLLKSSNDMNLKVGVFGVNEEEVITSTLVNIPVIVGSSTSGATLEITYNLYEQIMQKIDQVKKGEVEPELIFEAVTEYLQNHPVSADIDVAQEVADYITANLEELKGDTYDDTEVRSAIDDLGTEINTLISKNVINGIDTTDITENGYWSQNNGNFVTNQNFNACNKYIPVTPTSVYSSWYVRSNTIAASKNIVVCWYDKNKNFISGTYNTESTYTSPNNAYYARISYMKAQNKDYIFKSGSDAPTQYTPFKIEDTLSEEVKIPNLEKISNNNPLSGKKLATAGTSITAGAGISIDSVTGIKMTYGAIVAQRNNMEFVNYGIGGSTLQYIDGKHPFSDPSRYQSMDEDLDYLTIEFGWNDNAYGTLGTITDSDNTTYYGAWNVVLPWLIEHYPNTKIGLIVPYGTTAEMREAVRLIAKKYCVGYMDMTGNPNIPLLYNREASFNVDANIQTLYRNRYLADGVHPNNAGYEAWATAYEAFLKTL